MVYYRRGSQTFVRDRRGRKRYYTLWMRGIQLFSYGGKMEDRILMGSSPVRESRHYGLVLLLLLALMAYAAIGLTLRAEPASRDPVDAGNTILVDQHGPAKESWPPGRVPTSASLP
jgi:hypothetical protein